MGASGSLLGGLGQRTERPDRKHRTHRTDTTARTERRQTGHTSRTGETGQTSQTGQTGHRHKHRWVGRSQERSPGALGTILVDILEDLGTLVEPIFYAFGEDLGTLLDGFSNICTEQTPTRGRNSRKRRRSGRGAMERPRGAVRVGMAPLAQKPKDTRSTAYLSTL